MFISKYEAFLTNTPIENWNKALPLISISCQIIISIFLIGTAVNIRVLFKCRPGQQGIPKIKNTISFNLINILYSSLLILETVLHLTLLQIDSKDTYILHYDSTLAFTLVLMTFILFNEDARMFCLDKFRSWKEEQVFRSRCIKYAMSKAAVTPLGATVEQPDTIAVIPLNGSVFIV